MKTRILKFNNRLLSKILAMLGLGAAISESCALYGTPAEYGTPYATFKVMGKVTTVEEIPVQNIRVVLDYDTSFTDASGNYEVKTINFPTNQTFSLHFKDVDNEQNGEFTDLDTTAEFKNPQFTGGDGDWYDGETEIELNVKLKSAK
ncbi:MAG: radical SAM-associated putative lipoprotein [Bacteroidales bacterium]